MSKHMERDLDFLHRAVLAMADLAEEAVIRATGALLGSDANAAQAVIAADNAIDRFENEVQEECLKILALHQPVAGDLRRVSSVLLISTDLERIGDLAVGIAERATTLSATDQAVVPGRIASMAARTTEMVRRSLDAFVHHDTNAAREVIRLDDEVDADNAAIISELMDGMKQQPDRLEVRLSLFSAVRNLERIADHTTNIAEDVIYLVEGRQVRHHN